MIFLEATSLSNSPYRARRETELWTLIFSNNLGVYSAHHGNDIIFQRLVLYTFFKGEAMVGYCPSPGIRTVGSGAPWPALETIVGEKKKKEEAHDDLLFGLPGRSDRS